MKESRSLLLQVFYQFDTIQKFQTENWIIDDAKFQFNGFNKRILETSARRLFFLYIRDPLRELQQQVNFVRSCEKVTKPDGNGEQSHVSNSDIRRFACTGVEEKVKRSMDANTVW